VRRSAFSDVSARVHSRTQTLHPNILCLCGYLCLSIESPNLKHWNSPHCAMIGQRPRGRHARIRMRRRRHLRLTTDHASGPLALDHHFSDALLFAALGLSYGRELFQHALGIVGCVTGGSRWRVCCAAAMAPNSPIVDLDHWKMEDTIHSDGKSGDAKNGTGR
jgi:hypothetical protein